MHSDEATRCEARVLEDLRLLHGHDALKQRGGKECRQSSDRFEAGRINPLGDRFGSGTARRGIWRHLTSVSPIADIGENCDTCPYRSVDNFWRN